MCRYVSIHIVENTHTYTILYVRMIQDTTYRYTVCDEVWLIVQVEVKYGTWHEEYAESQQRIGELQAYQQKISEEMEKLKELETEENKE